MTTLSVPIYTSYTLTVMVNTITNNYGSTAYCLSNFSATGAKLCWSLPFPWTTPVSWRREACYMSKAAIPTLIAQGCMHSGECKSVCRSIVSGDQQMPIRIIMVLKALPGYIPNETIHYTSAPTNYKVKVVLCVKMQAKDQ